MMSNVSQSRPKANRAAGVWVPLLAGGLAREALDVARSIAGTTDAGTDERSSPWYRRGSLSNGGGGLAVLYGYMAQAFPDEGWSGAAARSLDECIAALREQQQEPFLYSGFSGIGWAAAHLDRCGLGVDADCGDIDEAVAILVRQSPCPYDYDLVRGVVGLGVYALERLPDAKAAECLELVVARLEETAVEVGPRLTWRSRPENIGEEGRKLTPRGHFNTGLAHGVPGVIALLALIRNAGLCLPRCDRLLRGAVAWLLAQELPAGAGSRFPAFFSEPCPPRPSRGAWCYGDPGVAAALLLAGVQTGERAWVDTATRIALEVARRPPETQGVRDASVCHGAAGLAHLLNRIYQATGERELAEAACYWLRRTLEMRRQSSDKNGYRFLVATPDGTGLEWRGDRGLLTGTAGVALVLLAAATPVMPAWDRMLLVDVPPLAAE